MDIRLNRNVEWRFCRQRTELMSYKEQTIKVKLDRSRLRAAKYAIKYLRKDRDVFETARAVQKAGNIYIPGPEDATTAPTYIQLNKATKNKLRIVEP